MEKKNSDFAQIDLLKERYRLRIQEQETRIKSSFSDITDNLTGVALFNKIRENLFGGSGFAFKLGIMAVTMLRKRLNRKNKK